MLFRSFKHDTNIKFYDNVEFEEYPIHWHTPPELLMPIEGIYKVICCDQTILLHEFDILIICPCCLHHLFASPGRRIIFQPDLSILRDIKEIDSFLTTISPFLLITPENNPTIHSHIKALLLQCMDEYKKEEVFSETAIYSIVLQILLILARNLKMEETQINDNKTQKQQEYHEKFVQICNYITDNCTENLTLEQMADMAGFSKYHFSRLFHQYTHSSFYTYITHKRIAKSEKLLDRKSVV